MIRARIAARIPSSASAILPKGSKIRMSDQSGRPSKQARRELIRMIAESDASFWNTLAY